MVQITISVNPLTLSIARFQTMLVFGILPTAGGNDPSAPIGHRELPRRIPPLLMRR